MITHAHSDHARPGHRSVLASADTLALMRARLGEGRAGETQQALSWGEAVRIGDVRVWLQPAGHVLGSAQVAMEYQGARAVISGDYKRTADPDLRRLRAGPVRRVRDRGDVCPAGVPPPSAASRRSAGCWRVWRCFPTGRMSSAATRWGSASG